MGDFQQLIRFEVANSAVAFRERAYGKEDRQELLRDLLGLANAFVTGPRYVFLGVRDTVGGTREIVGISESEAAAVQKFCQKLAADYIDPPLPVRIEETLIDEVRVTALVLLDCDDPPYLLKRSASNTMRTGSGWIRQGTSYSRVTRADLQRMFEQKLRSQTAGAELRVGFAGRVLEPVLHLPVMRLGRLPSEVASVKLQRMLEAKQAARQVAGADGTRIQRLVHAQLFGLTELYRADSDGTLLERLEQAGQDYAAADKHYEFEQCSHKLNLMIENVSGVPCERGTLVLDFPRMDGVDIAEQIWPDPESPDAVPDGYPTVEIGPRTMRVQTTLPSIPAEGKAMAFRQPLRVCLREPGIGKTVPISYSVHGRGLRATVSGTLRLVIDDSESKALPVRKDSAA